MVEERMLGHASGICGCFPEVRFGVLGTLCVILIA